MKNKRKHKKGVIPEGRRPVRDPMGSTLKVRQTTGEIRPDGFRQDLRRTRGNDRKSSGKVYLVGAGPGDPGLLTLRGAELLQLADVIVYDRLISQTFLETLELWNARAEKIYAGKEAGKPATEKGQTAINALLVKLARAGKVVIRLKGGDPFVFGRGGEEAGYLAQAKIPYEVVPGVSAGWSVPAYAGIPVTDRRFASSVTFVTGHEESDKKAMAVRWDQLAKQEGTIVSFMSMQTLPSVIAALVRGGKSPKTPVAVIEWGTLPERRVVEGTLQDIVQRVTQKKIQAPALTVIGDVVQLRQKLAWFEKRPLYGKTVLITRARAQSSRLKKQLLEQGARVLEFPAIRIEEPKDYTPLDRAIETLADFDWILFTSTNGVEAFMRRMARMGHDARHFGRTRVAVIGEGTELQLLSYGLRADLKPDRFTSESLVERFEQMHEIQNRRFLLPRTDIAPDLLPKALAEKGGRVTQVTAYRTVTDTSARKQLQKWLRDAKIDYILFTSSSTVENFFKAVPAFAARGPKPRFISIGPVTSETLKQFGQEPYRQAEVHTISGLVEVLTHAT